MSNDILLENNRLLSEGNKILSEFNNLYRSYLDQIYSIIKNGISSDEKINEIKNVRYIAEKIRSDRRAEIQKQIDDEPDLNIAAWMNSLSSNKNNGGKRSKRRRKKKTQRKRRKVKRRYRGKSIKRQ